VVKPNLKEIQKEELALLLRNKILKNTTRGIVDKRGLSVGFYRTRNKRYIEDKYADIAKRIS